MDAPTAALPPELPPPLLERLDAAAAKAMAAADDLKIGNHRHWAKMARAARAALLSQLAAEGVALVPQAPADADRERGAS
jgi:hypothetical protein